MSSSSYKSLAGNEEEYKEKEIVENSKHIRQVDSLIDRLLEEIRELRATKQMLLEKQKNLLNK